MWCCVRREFAAIAFNLLAVELICVGFVLVRRHNHRGYNGALDSISALSAIAV